MFTRVSDKKRINKNFLNRGYTLLELLICIIIFAIITAVVIYKYGDFNNNLVMTNQAYEMSLAVRQAQIYGLSVRKTNDNFSTPYGIHITKGNVSPFIFADVNRYSSNNGIYTASDTSIEVLPLQLGTVIDDICARSTANASEVCGYQTADITFIRPNPDAYIRVNGNSTTYSSVKLVMKAPNGKKRNVVVRVTGQISIEIPS